MQRLVAEEEGRWKEQVVGETMVCLESTKSLLLQHRRGDDVHIHAHIPTTCWRKKTLSQNIEHKHWYDELRQLFAFYHLNVVVPIISELVSHLASCFQSAYLSTILLSVYK